MDNLDFNRIADSTDAGRRILGSEDEVASQVQQIDLGEPGLGKTSRGIAARISVAEANRFEEKLKAFRTIYPDGDLRLVSESDLQPRGYADPQSLAGTPAEQLYERRQELIPVPRSVLLFREDPSQPFKRVDAKEFEPIGDIVDFVMEDLGAIAGEIVAGARTKGVSFLKYLTRLSAGAALGEIGQQALQTARGIQEDSVGEIGERAITQAALAATGATIARPAEALARVARGGGLLKLSPERREALAAFERLGLERPLPGQISDNPFIQKLQAQTSSVFPTFARFTEEKQVKPVVEIIKSLRDPAAKSNFLSTLVSEHKKIEEAALSVARRTTRNVSLEKAGKVIKSGQKKLDDEARKRVNDLYGLARSIEEPVFDISDLRSEARIIALGTPFKMQSLGEEITESTLKELGLSETQIKKLIPSGADKSLLASAEKLDPDLLRIAKQIISAADELPPVPLPNGQVSTATEQLRAWRSELFDLSRPVVTEAGRVRRGNAAAGRLKAAIDDVLENPANVSDEFQAAWSAANKAARKRFNRLELTEAAVIAKSDKPAALAARYARPGPEAADNLRQLRTLITSDSYRNMQEAFKQSLINDPKNIGKRLSAFDRNALNLLMSQEDQKVFRQVADKMTEMEGLGLDKIVARRGGADDAFKEILSNTTTPADRKLFVQTVLRHGDDSHQFRSVQAALIDYIWNAARRSDKNLQYLDPKALKSILNELNEKGLSPLLGRNAKGILADLRTIADFLPRAGEDFGSSLLGAEVVSETRRKIFSPKELLVGPVLRLIHLAGVGALMVSPAMRRVMVGTSRKVPDSHLLSTFSAGLTTIAGDMNAEAIADKLSSAARSGAEGDLSGKIDFDRISEETGN